jgi:tetraacyldisaccharide 4'-kinase
VKHWYKRTALSWLLWPASLVFGVVVRLRRILYRLRILPSEAAGIPVIVVGNLIVGGSGKTPLALWIVELLNAKGYKPALLSRGYGGRAAARKDAVPLCVTITSDPAEVGDEPVVLARRSGVPVWVCADRVAAARAALSQSPDRDVLVLDDGLQHYRLRRDIEVALVDSRGSGNGWLLPAGPLREPASRLRSVDAVVSHGTKTGGYTMQLAGDAVVRMGDAREVRPLTSFSGQRVHAVAGIGNPNRFFLQLAAAGIKPIPHPFPDHHAFRVEDLAFGDELPVLMTEKDAVKLRSAARANWWVFPVRAEVDPAFGDWLLKRLAAIRPRKT